MVYIIGPGRGSRLHVPDDLLPVGMITDISRPQAQKRRRTEYIRPIIRVRV